MTKVKWIIVVSLTGLFFTVSFLFVDRAADKINLLKGAITTTHKVHSDLLMMRRNEKDFLSRFDKGYVDRFANNYAIVLSDIQRLKSELVGTPLANDIPKFEEAITAYFHSFNQLASLQEKIGLGPYQGYYGKLRDDAHRIEKILIQYDEPRLMNTLLTLRRKEKDFMLRDLEQYIQQFNEYIKIFETQLKQKESVNQHDKQSMLSLLSSYHENFLAYSQSIIEKGLNNHDGLLGEMSQRAHVLDRMFELFEHQLLDTSMSMEINTNRHTRILMIVFVVGVLTIALIPFIFFMMSNKEAQA